MTEEDPDRRIERAVYGEAHLDHGLALTKDAILRTWYRDSELTAILEYVRAVKSYGDEVYAIKGDDSLWRLSGYGTEAFLSAPEAEFVTDGVRETSGHLVLLQNWRVLDLDRGGAEVPLPWDIVYIHSNGLGHAAITWDGGLYLWGTFFEPGNRQSSVTLEAPALICEDAVQATVCYSGVLILKHGGELLVCETDGERLFLDRLP